MLELSCQNIMSAGTTVQWNTHENVTDIILIPVTLVWECTE